MITKECFETEDEREKLFDLIDKLPLCRKTVYETVQAKLESGAARTRREAEKQIADETGKRLSTVRQTIRREAQSHKVDTVYPDCDSFSQAPVCQIPHVAQNTGNNEWYTPPEYITAARRVLGNIDLDPASSSIANQTIQAEAFYTADDDGLAKEWRGKVWMNPPYAGHLIGKFCDKLCQHYLDGEVSEAIVLVNNATETNWFNNLANTATAIVFPMSRVRFLDPEGNPGAPLQGQAVVYLGNNPDLFLSEFWGFGWAAKVWQG